MKGQLLGCLKVLLVIGGAFLCLLTLGVLFVVGQQSYEYHYGFNKQRWLKIGQILRSDTEDRGILGTDNPRESMVQDVMAHYLRVGMTRMQVLALLGPPEKDEIEWVVPDGVALPDSLNYALMSNEAILKQHPESFNNWHAQHAQPDTLMRYRVGWDFIDPTSMRIEFNGNGQVRKFWVGIQ